MMFPRYWHSTMVIMKVFIVYKEVLELPELEQHEGTIAG